MNDKYLSLLKTIMMVKFMNRYTDEPIDLKPFMETLEVLGTQHREKLISKVKEAQEKSKIQKEKLLNPTEKKEEEERKVEKKAEKKKDDDEEERKVEKKAEKKKDDDEEEKKDDDEEEELDKEGGIEERLKKMKKKLKFPVQNNPGIVEDKEETINLPTNASDFDFIDDQEKVYIYISLHGGIKEEGNFVIVSKNLHISTFGIVSCISKPGGKEKNAVDTYNNLNSSLVYNYGNIVPNLKLSSKSKDHVLGIIHVKNNKEIEIDDSINNKFLTNSFHPFNRLDFWTEEKVGKFPPYKTQYATTLVNVVKTLTKQFPNKQIYIKISSCLGFLKNIPSCLYDGYTLEEHKNFKANINHKSYYVMPLTDGTELKRINNESSVYSNLRKIAKTPYFFEKKNLSINQLKKLIKSEYKPDSIFINNNNKIIYIPSEQEKYRWDALEKENNTNKVYGNIYIGYFGKLLKKKYRIEKDVSHLKKNKREASKRVSHRLFPGIDKKSSFTYILNEINVFIVVQTIKDYFDLNKCKPLKDFIDDFDDRFGNCLSDPNCGIKALYNDPLCTFIILYKVIDQLTGDVNISELDILMKKFDKENNTLSNKVLQCIKCLENDNCGPEMNQEFGRRRRRSYRKKRKRRSNKRKRRSRRKASQYRYKRRSYIKKQRKSSKHRKHRRSKKVPKKFRKKIFKNKNTLKI